MKEALETAGRQDLIGFEKKCLIRPYPPGHQPPHGAHWVQGGGKSAAKGGKNAGSSRGRKDDKPARGGKSERSGGKSAPAAPKSGKRPSGWAKPKAAKSGKPNSRKKQG